jgi:uncharacterized LabA/DUF88 family protein
MLGLGATVVSSSNDREYLFIDGGSLRSSVRKICQDLFGDANAYQPYLPGIATGQYAKVFLYDAVPGKEHGESQAAYEARVLPEHERFSKIRALDRVHVALGQIVGADKRQKGVDVQLAVDMMTHAFRGNISRATLFAGDADFVPLIKALVGEGLQVTLWHPPQANAELRGAADSTRLFEFKANYAGFTADGQQSAFWLAGGVSGGHPKHSGLRIVTVNEVSYAGSWNNEALTLWRGTADSWAQNTLHAPAATFARAVKAFDQIIPGWGLAAAGEEWIERA